MTNDHSIDQTPIWQALGKHRESFQHQHLKDLFTKDSERGSRLSAEAAGIYFDYSKNPVTEATLSLFEELVSNIELERHITELFSGAIVNQSEQRPALHTALRQNREHSRLHDPALTQSIESSLEHMLDFAEALRAGSILGSSGQSITHVVNLGIGGSDLGPRLAVNALAGNHSQSVQVYFVANIDSDDLQSSLEHCEPERTLFIVSSKSFSTQETLSNAELAKTWLLTAGIKEDNLKTHFAAITSQPEKALSWGIARHQVHTIGDWVGGRFSLWSAMGLPVAIALGSSRFKELLAGAAAMDDNFQNAPLRENLALLHGLINIWHINFWGCKSRAILPYVHKLQKLPNYIQQLVMESLGKRVTQTGEALNIATGQVIWGGEETNGQHSFHQLLLQGVERIPADFIVTQRPHCSVDQHRQLYANCLAQSQALMMGTMDLSSDQHQESQHQTVPGDQPSNTLILDELSPRCLGALLALYEHSVFIQSAVWGINAFDQWGVELGKQLGLSVAKKLSITNLDSAPKTITGYDDSTRELIRRYHTRT